MDRVADRVDEQWVQLRSRLPDDLEESARRFGVFQRKREIRSAEDLLRLALIYSACDESLRATALHANALGIGDMSDVAVLYRLRELPGWLEHVLAEGLSRAGPAARPRGALPVRIVDATSIMEPGRHSGEFAWRLHFSLDLATNRMSSLELTTAHGGETLLRHPIQSGEVVVADRGYGSQKQIVTTLQVGAHVAIRLLPKQVPLWTPEGERVDALSLATTLTKDGELGDWPCEIHYRKKQYPVRLVILRLDQGGRERGQRRAQEKAWKNQHSLSERSVAAADYLMVVTDLPQEQFPAQEVVDLYQLRWRIETYFKRLKSHLGLDRLRAHEPGLVRTYILAKLIMAVLVEEVVDDWLDLLTDEDEDESIPESEAGPFPP